MTIIAGTNVLTGPAPVPPRPIAARTKLLLKDPFFPPCCACRHRMCSTFSHSPA
jgi:hypothetical protein